MSADASILFNRVVSLTTFDPAVRLVVLEFLTNPAGFGNTLDEEHFSSDQKEQFGTMVSWITENWVQRSELTVDSAKAFLLANGYFAPTRWHKEDITARAKDRNIILTEEQVNKIAESLVSNHESSVGINWETIDIVTDEIIKESV